MALSPSITIQAVNTLRHLAQRGTPPSRAMCEAPRRVLTAEGPRRGRSICSASSLERGDLYSTSTDESSSYAREVRRRAREACRDGPEAPPSTRESSSHTREVPREAREACRDGREAPPSTRELSSHAWDACRDGWEFHSLNIKVFALRRDFVR